MAGNRHRPEIQALLWGAQIANRCAIEPATFEWSADGEDYSIACDAPDMIEQLDVQVFGMCARILPAA